MVHVHLFGPLRSHSSKGISVDNRDQVISVVKDQVSHVTGIKKEQIELIFAGQRLMDSKMLKDYPGLGDNSTVYAVQKSGEQESRERPTEEEVESLVTSFQTALMDHQHRSLLFSIISSPEGLSTLISATPGLKKDTVAQGILKDPYLLMHWLANEDVVSRLEEHPCLLEAGSQLLASLHSEAAARALPPSPSNSDVDSESEDEQQRGQVEEAMGRGGDAGAQITAQQLAAALAGHFAAAAQQQQPSAPQQPINQEMLQAAMAQAQVGQNQQWNEAVQQLREMGFTDDRENRIALQVSNGDFQAAVEYIIAQRELD